jgi:hypothetical protein
MCLPGLGAVQWRQRTYARTRIDTRTRRGAARPSKVAHGPMATEKGTKWGAAGPPSSPQRASRSRSAGRVGPRRRSERSMAATRGVATRGSARVGALVLLSLVAACSAVRASLLSSALPQPSGTHACSAAAAAYRCVAACQRARRPEPAKRVLDGQDPKIARCARVRCAGHGAVPGQRARALPAQQRHQPGACRRGVAVAEARSLPHSPKLTPRAHAHCPRVARRSLPPPTPLPTRRC